MTWKRFNRLWMKETSRSPMMWGFYGAALAAGGYLSAAQDAWGLVALGLGFAAGAMAQEIYTIWEKASRGPEDDPNNERDR